MAMRRTVEALGAQISKTIGYMRSYCEEAQ